VDSVPSDSICALAGALDGFSDCAGKVLLLHEDTLTGGIGGEISAWISEHCFELLDAPVLRCASLDTPVPFNIELEKNFLAAARLDECIRKLKQY